jgi:hypothetical protein
MEILDTTKVIIEKWPNNPLYKDWIPIVIAIIALTTSIISLYWTRKEFIKNSRPYVWASNYGVIDTHNKTIIPIPFRIALRVKNTPAKIIRLDVEIKYKTEILFSHVVKNIVKFPDEASEWSFDLSKDDFEKIMNRPNTDKSDLIRTITIKYSSFDDGKIYVYQLQQSFEPTDNQWTDTYENAD